MLRVVRTIINALVIVSALLAAAIPAQSQMTAPNPAKVAELKMVLRDLYVNHIFWVRSLVIATRLRQSAAAKVADEEGMENAKEIGQSITPYYGQAASQKFVTLFTGHYVAEKAYMNAAFANNFGGNAAAKKAAENRLMKNAEEIAAFVSGANPNLPKALVYRLLLTHGQQQVMAIDDIGKGAWSDEADMWNAMVKHIYTLTGTLAEGTAKEFPEMFQ